jgi:hypothetical protein
LARERGEFQWGISIDNMWIYAGAAPPKSIVIPHLPNVELPQGPFSPRMVPPESLATSQYSTLSNTLSNQPDNNSEERKTLCKSVAKQLKSCGIDFVRGWFQWNLFQKKIAKGEKQDYEFPLDDFVQIFNEEGIKIIAVLGNGYYRFLPKRLNIDNPVQYMARLMESSREIVRHYSRKICMWQLENEPNWWLQHFSADWRRGGVWFERKIDEMILSGLQRIVKEEDGETQTMINLEVDTAKVFFKTYAKYCDLLGLDFYPNYLWADPMGSPEVSRIAREARIATGNKVMVAETGYPSGPFFFGFNDAKQARYVSVVSNEAYSTEDVIGLGMWRLSDTYWYSFPYQENNFGLLTRTGLPKKAWLEYVNQIRQLG